MRCYMRSILRISALIFAMQLSKRDNILCINRVGLQLTMEPPKTMLVTYHKFDIPR